MKRYLIAVGVVLAMIVSAAPVAATEPSVPKDAYGLPYKGSDSIYKFVRSFQSSSTVEQSNDNKSGDATAVNWNTTDQTNDQKQVGAGGDAASGDSSSDGSVACRKDGRWDPKEYPKRYPKSSETSYGYHKKNERCHDGSASGKAAGGDVDQGQTAENTNSTKQHADADSKAYQVVPINVNAPIRVLSYGDDRVEQDNHNTSGDATAVNKNRTDQSNDQVQYGAGGDAESGAATSGDGSDKCGCRSDGSDASTGDAYGGDVSQSQDASNSNRTKQKAEAESKAVQIVPINVNAPIRVLSYGDSEVKQSNDNESGDATAVNYNSTDQSNEQKQLGAGGDAESGTATADGSGDASTGKAAGGDVDQGQWADNSNSTYQDASAESKAVQIVPINVNAPISVLSHGDTEVDQSNDNESGDATAVNKNSTEQSNDQTQIGFGGDAESGAATSEDGSNKCGCYSDGGDASSGDAYGGDVSQSQDASNANETAQNAEASSSAGQIVPINANVLGGGMLGGAG